MRKVRRENRAATERRRATRYEEGLPANFRWLEGEVTKAGYGICRDLSCEGAFVATNDSPTLGCKVTVDVRVPLPPSSSRDVKFSGNGVVVRLNEGTPGERGFAVSGHFNLKRRTKVSPAHDPSPQIRALAVDQNRGLSPLAFAGIDQIPKAKAE
jgi:hypothetical protein